MIAAVAAYPSVDAVAVNVVVVVALVLAFGGAVTAWAAGRPGPVAPRGAGRPCARLSFDANCRHDKSSAECPERQGGVCDE